ncbi:uncharacterized protein GBIM_19346 [Gryllus bimaculatus]|nr:uncharacterized protein GBIM_19346 [Gryllus bimaculatus]
MIVITSSKISAAQFSQSDRSICLVNTTSNTICLLYNSQISRILKIKLKTMYIITIKKLWLSTLKILKKRHTLIYFIKNVFLSSVILVFSSVYGDVQRVKILYNKKDSALIQMAEPHQAHLAMTHMDKLRVFGKQIRVMPSKHQTVQLPKEGQPDAGLTKDFTNSALHRFKKPGSKNYQNIYPPSATLHLSNIPPSISEEEIKEAFTKNGFHVKAFKFFPKDRKMALIQLPSMDDAVTALIKMHNYQLSSCLKVCSEQLAVAHMCSIYSDLLMISINTSSGGSCGVN